MENMRVTPERMEKAFRNGMIIGLFHPLHALTYVVAYL